MVTVLFDEPRVFLSYGSASLMCGDDLDDVDLDAPWADESNGLCGAGVPGYLQFQVGTHTGWVPFRLELHDAEPVLDPAWEEVVEVSFTALSEEASLTGLMGDRHEFTVPRGDYRVRYCVRGFEEADEVEGTPDSYLLQFWPGAPAPGRIVKQTGERAAYWHRARRTLTEPEQQENEQAAVDELEQRARERWGGRVPSERLRRTLEFGVGLYLEVLSRLDMDLEFALADADDRTHRQVAAWAAVQCLEEAGLIGLPQLAPAVAALRRGDPAPPPFDDSGHCWSVLRQAQPPRTSRPSPPDGDYEQSPQDWAITTLFHSAEEDSLVAAMEVVVCLAFVHGRDGYHQAYAALRTQFPQLR
ncbi:hypothetical protein [Paractinoplanes durhamensis]|uniref:Uncharacterized protein n=1 Tax=Paractinoplanes durhamensis TaxID=113563 RepID=A0ABQ3YUW8_9ACTN|nr:hypothetical protein [Actinoplanes durhamensis]GIE01327.1 hypothetical protein Adu01nite_26770 [Actinoplanes durhamensis]